MNAENRRLLVDERLDRGERARHRLGRVGDQCREQRRRPIAAMSGGNGANSLWVRLIVEKHITPAVHLQVDESGHKPGALGQDISRHVGCHRVPRNDGQDTRTLDDNGRVVRNGGAVEHSLRHYGVLLGLPHRVRVTFWRWRGWSTFVPRWTAMRTASAKN